MDEAAARVFLAQRFDDAARIALMRPDEWSAAYSVRTADADLVVRFSAYDEDFEKDAYAARWASPALPIPPIIEFGPAPEGFYAVAPRGSGGHIDGVGATRLRRLLPSFFGMLDAMRAADLSATSGYGGWRADGRTQNVSWREHLLGVASGPATRGSRPWRELLAASPSWITTFEEGYARLRELVPFCPEDRHLIHDDLMNRNVLVAGDRITAVLDWGSSKYGDFVFDLAKPVFYAPWYPQWREIDFAAEARAHYATIGLTLPRFDERLRCYLLFEGIGGMAYSAFRERWTEVDRKAARVLELARK